jgi:glucose-1-phosphatase
VIKAIIFDWGGVLFDDPCPPLFTYWAIKFGVPKDKFIRAWNACMPLYHTGRITTTQFWDNMTKYLEIPHVPLSEIHTRYFYASYHENRKVTQLVRRLRKCYKTALLSNMETKWWTTFHKRIPPYFDAKVFSYKVGYAKPSKKVYKIVLQKLKIKPSEAIFIDDTLKNVSGARAVGLHAILFSSVTQLKKDLKKFKVM